jgi:hypothetical protein
VSKLARPGEHFTGQVFSVARSRLIVTFEEDLGPHGRLAV